jgi:hypothetical protein
MTSRIRCGLALKYRVARAYRPWECRNSAYSDEVRGSAICRPMSAKRKQSSLLTSSRKACKFDRPRTLQNSSVRFDGLSITPFTPLLSWRLDDGSPNSNIYTRCAVLAMRPIETHRHEDTINPRFYFPPPGSYRLTVKTKFEAATEPS